MSAPENRVDLFRATQKGCVLLADTSREFLEAERSKILGRLVIALTFQALMQRATMPRDARRPTLLVIDEAWEVIDPLLEEFIVLVRKMRGGVIFAHQDLDQIATSTRKRILGNCGIKLIGGVSDHDARELAGVLRTSPGFILGRGSDGRSADFALHVRGRSAALPARLPFFTLENRPHMSKAEWRQVCEANRQRYGAPWQAPPASTVAAPADDDDWRS